MGLGIKRRRADPGASDSKGSKASASELPVRRDLLGQYYNQVVSLRHYFLSALPSGSRLRRKKLAAIGQAKDCNDSQRRLANLLDRTLVCSQGKSRQQQKDASEARWKQWISFSQQADESCVTISGDSSSSFSQSEIVDFVIWTLFEKGRKSNNAWPKHLLCDGFRRSGGRSDKATAIPGISSMYPNSHVRMIQEAPWPHVLALLGRAGHRLMIDLLLDCSIFASIDAGWDNYMQLSGFPFSELDMSITVSTRLTHKDSISRRPSDITLVRSRIFYAKPALTARGLIQAGLKHIHVLNRCPHGQPNDTNMKRTMNQLQNELNTTKVMMYIFPRQFKLHNVFTSEVDFARSAQKFHDYTLREEEIKTLHQDPLSTSSMKTPKRLRGAARHLTERLQVRHGRCSYYELLRHYCPTTIDSPRLDQTSDFQRAPNAAHQSRRIANRRTQSSAHRSQWRSQATPQLTFDSVVQLASPSSHVSAFCQAVLSTIIPQGFWGEGNTMLHNKKAFLRKVEHFINLRLFETMSLHELAQDFCLIDIPWLGPPRLQGQKTSQTDINKRQELFHEFLYYAFDSLLIPLIRCNFHVTESSTDGYRILYYRHDIWKRIAEPAMAALKERMFEEVKLPDANRILDSRRLGFSYIRLLPKGRDLRPITNLRRRAPMRKNAKVLGPSINFVLSPIHTLLRLEKRTNPSKVGSTMFAVSDMYQRLKDFKRELGTPHGHLYFAKVDVQGAFDTIPQEAVVRVVTMIPSQNQYTMTKHAELKPGERAATEADRTATKPTRRWHTVAMADRDKSSFIDRLSSDLGQKKRNTVFVNSSVLKTHLTSNLMSLMTEHVQQNLVKMGKKFYRQKVGIPQGSVLSSFLCNYFYADLEANHLDFLKGPDALLLRLIDDFLLITLDKSKAIRFVETMHQGLPEYGVRINPTKTLVNFDMKASDATIHRVQKENGFPYCGTLIDCQTLDITKDRRKYKDANNSLTVDYGRSPGQNFQRKILNAFKIQSHLMFFDTSHNATSTVLRSLHAAFCETSSKLCAYIQCLPKKKQPRYSLIIRTISKVIAVAFSLLTGRSRKMRYEHYACDIRKAQVTTAACQAFKQVLTLRQSKYKEVIAWLDGQLAVAQSSH